MAKKTIRITFRSEMYIDAESVQEAKQIWETTELYSKEAKKLGAEFIEINSVEDNDTYNDLLPEWDSDY